MNKKTALYAEIDSRLYKKIGLISKKNKMSKTKIIELLIKEVDKDRRWELTKLA